MLRKDIEVMMKTKKQKSITLVYNKNDKLGMYCFLSSGYLVDCWGHRVDRNKDIWGYIEWDGKGNADRVDFNCTAIIKYDIMYRKMKRKGLI